MEFLGQIFSDFGNIFKITWAVLFRYYGWVLFVLAFIYLSYKRYMAEIQHQFVHKQEWVFLSIRVPRTNTTSTLAVEQIFSQLHSLHTGPNFAQKYVEGQINLWYRLELVSLGGKTSFIIRAPKKMRNVVEAAVFAQYPDSEIIEVEDYLKNLTYDPVKTPDIDIFGTEVKLVESDVIPIKTYRDFEHPTAEEKIIDPLQPMLESLAKVEPHELFAVQYILQPLADDEWKPKGESKIKQLIGEEEAHHTGVLDILLWPFALLSKASFLDIFGGGGHGHGGHDTNKPKNYWQFMTEGEKERVSLIERKIGKPGYKTKIRMLYLASRAKFDSTKKSMVIGAFRTLGSAMSNKMKPDVNNTWTSIDYVVSEPLEKAYIEVAVNKRKRHFFKGFKNRDIHIGLPMFVMNIEEIATLFHFPITTKETTVSSQIERTEGRKYQPPVDLPIAENF
jgi:hypothetical protein